MHLCVGTVLERCCACVPGFKLKSFLIWELFPPITQQTVTEKYEFVRSFLRFVLDLPTLEWKCHLLPAAVSLCVFIMQPTTPWWYASQHAQYRASNLFICGEKGQANTVALMLEVLYLSKDPDIWLVFPCVRWAIVYGTACGKGLFFKRASMARTCESEHTTLCLCVCVYVCVCVSEGT